MQIEIKLQDFDKVKDKLKELQNINFNPFLRDVGEMIEESAKKSFSTQTDPWGKKWTPLSPATVQAKKGKSDGILYREGTMQGSLGFVLSGGSVKVGVNASSSKGYNYPAVHQFGSKDGKVPQRAFLPVDIDGKLESGVQEEIEDLLGKEIKSLF